jgi:DNA-directed RNA polymerase subunit beta'
LGDENIDWRGTKKKVKTDGKVSRYLHSSLYGRVLSEDIKVGKKLVQLDNGQKLTKGTYINAEVLDAIGKSGVDDVHVLTPFNSLNPESMDPLCYGFSLATGKPVEVGEAVGIISAQSIGEPGTQLTMRTFHTGGVVGLDITSGLPRIVELFEARTPKGKAVLSPINGKVKSIEVTPEGNRNVLINNEKEEVELLVLRRQTLLVAQGDALEAGQSLTTGPKDPKEVLQINGVRTCQEYLVDEVQKTYRDQGVEVHDKHVEMIVRQMLRRVRIVKSNDSEFLPNELADTTQFRKTNQELVKDGKVPAEGRPELMGITKASLATDSWLSAASFQETTRVLTEAAMKRSSDSLSGLKENVIIGTLIPAGTGSNAYQSVTPSLPDAPEVSELGFMTPSSEESDDDALPNPAQWLAMLGEEKEEEDE